MVNKITDPNKTNPVELTQTVNTQYTVTLNAKGSYLIGLSTVHIETSTGEVLGESQTLSWSDIPADCADTDGDGVGDPFGIRLFAALPSPKGMHPASP